MAVTTILNIILVAIIIICAWQGFKKGIIMGMIGVLVIILSLFGGQLLSDAFSGEVVPVLKPFVSGYMETRIQDTTYEIMGYEADEEGNYDVPYSLTDLMDSQPESGEEIARWVFREVGIYENMSDSMAEEVVVYAEENGVSISSSIITILCQTIAWYAGFLIGFIILYALMTVLVNLPNLSFRIPYVGIVNDIGGLGIGIFTGILFCAILVWFLQFLGLLIPEDTLNSAGLVSYFLDRNMLARYLTF